jgi:hypothetical protein
MVADPAVTIFVRQFPVVCNNIASSKINRREQRYRIEVTTDFRKLEYFVTVGRRNPQSGTSKGCKFYKRKSSRHARPVPPTATQ